ncbi:MAG: MATE family efflux transporter [Clostridia bacterium]|nr:MATE family efflux transporter [Clostridia bacterium]
MNLFHRFFSVRNLLPASGAQGEIPKSSEAYKNLIRIALPSVCEMVFISLMGSIDTMMVGGLGTRAIASVGLVGQPRMLILCLFFALNTGITAVVARRKGQDRQRDASSTLRTSLVNALVLSVFMLILSMFFARPLMRLAGAKPDTIDDAETYFKIVSLALPMNVMSMAICAAQRGIGNTRITMYVNITSNTVNVILNYLLINGIRPFPRLEVRGAAIATAIGMCVGSLLAFISLFHGRKGKGFLYVSIKEGGYFDRESAKAVRKIASSAMLEQLALRFGFFMYARLVADLGTQAYAAHTVCMQFLNLSFTFADGIGVAGTSLVGQMLGRERPDLSHIYGKISQRIALVGGIILASSIALFRYPLVGLFTDDPAVTRLSTRVMLIVALFQPLQMLSVITSGALRGAGDTRFVARVMLLCVAIIRPSVAFLAIRLITRFFTPIYEQINVLSAAETMRFWLSYETPQYALMGAWAASLIDMAIRMSLSMKRFNSGKWHNIKV